MRRFIQGYIPRLPAKVQLWVFENIDFLKWAFLFIRRQFTGKTSKLSKEVEDYCTYNREQVLNGQPQQSDLILIDCFPAPQWIMANSIFLNNLGERYQASIASYDILPRDEKLGEIYKSFGAETHLEISLSAQQRRRRDKLYTSILSELKTPEDLFQLRIDGVWIGLDIYETILRIGFPTVELDAYHTLHSLYQGLRYYIYFVDLIKSGCIKAVAPSHDCYIQMGIVTKIAQQFGVPVFYANPFEIAYSRSDHDLYDRFKYYPDFFKEIPQEDKDASIIAAKNALSKRLGGVVGVDMGYQLKSAFTDGNVDIQTAPSDKLKVLIATHCFFDNPHAYGRMCFRDFYQWLLFLGEISLRTDYDWYIKPHRDFLPGTNEVLAEIAKKYPKLKVINPETTFHQLKSEGVSVVLTCYGSVGHELPLLGFRVINTSYNPHIGYKFNTHCNSVAEYEDVLLNLDSLPPIDQSAIDDIYEFYAVHHYLTKPANLLFDDFSDYENYVEGDVLGDKCYEFFMKNPGRYVEKYKSHIDEFLEIGCQYEFELSIPNWAPKSYLGKTNGGLNNQEIQSGDKS